MNCTPAELTKLELLDSRIANMRAGLANGVSEAQVSRAMLTAVLEYMEELSELLHKQEG